MIESCRMQHFYRDVPGLGHVAVSRHAQAAMEALGLTDEMFQRILFEPEREVPDGLDVVWRERGGVRAVILLYPTPNRGARLVKTVYRVEAQARARAAVSRVTPIIKPLK